MFYTCRPYVNTFRSLCAVTNIAVFVLLFLFRISSLELLFKFHVALLFVLCVGTAVFCTQSTKYHRGVACKCFFKPLDITISQCAFLVFVPINSA